MDTENKKSDLEKKVANLELLDIEKLADDLEESLLSPWYMRFLGRRRLSHLYQIFEAGFEISVSKGMLDVTLNYLRAMNQVTRIAKGKLIVDRDYNDNCESERALARVKDNLIYTYKIDNPSHLEDVLENLRDYISHVHPKSLLVINLRYRMTNSEFLDGITIDGYDFKPPKPRQTIFEIQEEFGCK